MVKNVYAAIENILKNDLLFEPDFVEQQKSRLACLKQQDDSSDKMHEMPEENLKIAVVGAFSCGKSAFINSILEDEVAPSEIKPLTHGITSFIYGKQECCKADNEIISRDDYQKKVQGQDEKVKHFIIEYPCDRLKDFEFMDSPGFASVSGNNNATAKEDTQLSEEAVRRADIVFFLNNITEGIIQGDALNRLRSICTNESAGNPHRRIFVVLTWAESKAPKARNTIRDSIIQLCEEEKLPVDGVLLYSSKPEKAKKSDAEFFRKAKENLFATLVQLRADGQELKKYRIALKQQTESFARQKLISEFVQACRLFLSYQTSVILFRQAKEFEKRWADFLEKMVKEFSSVMSQHVENKIYSLINAEKLTDHTFSDYQVKFYFNVLNLDDENANKLKSGCLKLIAEDFPGIKSEIFQERFSKKEDEYSVYKIYNDICLEILYPLASPKFYNIESEADEAECKLRDKIKNAFSTKGPDLWSQYITIIFKNEIKEQILTPQNDSVKKQLSSVKRYLSQLSASHGNAPVVSLNLDLTKTDVDIFSALKLK